MVGPPLTTQICSAFTSLCGRLGGNCKVVDWRPGPGKWAPVTNRMGTCSCMLTYGVAQSFIIDLWVTKALGQTGFKLN